ncbi:hypothetical protein ASG76_14650 [Nocardioides sp. Soil774]|nr:hypothetical protein ASG76_14650 [Nocardioides sp. Soil774]
MKAPATAESQVAATVEGPGLVRVVTLTDAVVAIAMTLLVLPLVEVAGEVDTAHVRALLADHGDLLLSFAVSFVVIYVFWAAHGTALRRAELMDVEPRGLRQLNLGWLLVLAFLPFPTAVVGRDLNTTSAPMYIGTMLTLSALTSLIVNVVDRAVGPPRRAGWAWATTSVFAACTALSVYNADLGMFALLALAVVRIVEVRTESALDPSSPVAATPSPTPTSTPASATTAHPAPAVRPDDRPTHTRTGATS